MRDKERITQAIGSASLCWNPKPTGVFDAEAASQIADDCYDALGAPKQTGKLADYLMSAWPDEITGGGAGDVAIRILRRYEPIKETP